MKLKNIYIDNFTFYVDFVSAHSQLAVFELVRMQN